MSDISLCPSLTREDGLDSSRWLVLEANMDWKFIFAGIARLHDCVSRVGRGELSRGLLKSAIVSVIAFVDTIIAPFYDRGAPATGAADHRASPQRSVLRY